MELGLEEKTVQVPSNSLGMQAAGFSLNSVHFFNKVQVLSLKVQVLRFQPNIIGYFTLGKSLKYKIVNKREDEERNVNKCPRCKISKKCLIFFYSRWH